MTEYKNTIFLPGTSFSMKGNLPSLEPSILERWKKMDLYGQIRMQGKGRKKFILHMGPPYANGNLHIGHALTGILKDFVVRSHQMLGYDAPLVPGWDCHGLPIEWKIEEKYRKDGKQKEEISHEEFRRECRNFARHWIDIQREESIRLGILADWNNPYITMDPKAESMIVASLLSFLENGGLYKGFKPVMWSVVEKTALAEAEIEYHDHESTAIFVRFPVLRSPLEILDGASVVIWTTTPWSLPGNRAIAYGAEIRYAIVRVNGVLPESLARDGEKILVAVDLLDDLCEQLGIKDYVILQEILGSELAGTICAHCLHTHGYSHDVPLLPGSHVTVEAGTGLVHIAPGHGPEDFELGKACNLEIPDTLGDDGRFRDWVPLVGGDHVYKVDGKIVQALRDACALMQACKITHSYPHSWRSKAPLIYRATPQWFISMDKTGLRDTALKAIDNVSWFPAQARNRIFSMVEGRPDWCLSRQRTWGVPIPLFIHKSTGQVLNDPDVNRRIVSIFEEEGCEAWYQRPASDFLGHGYSDEDYEQVRDILDVWFESGATQAFVLEARPELSFPADVYLEGSDQHRGWFQSSLLIGCGTRGQAPFRSVVTHGFVLDEQGYKMSKSRGDALSPRAIIEKGGAELLRLWVAFSDYREDCRIGESILKHLEDMYRRFRNTLRYLLGALQGFEESERVEPANMPELERWVLHRLAELDRIQRDCIARHDFLTLISELHNFCAIDLSAFYFDIRKDSLYCDDPSSPVRRAVRTVFDMVFQRLVRWLAPFLCFTTEEAWLARYPDESSIHLQLFEELREEWLNPDLAIRVGKMRQQRRLITGALEKARAAGQIGSSLQAHVQVFDPDGILLEGIDYADISIVSVLEVIRQEGPADAFRQPDTPGLSVIVLQAGGKKCDRCWKILDEVGMMAEHPALCRRCCDVVLNRKP